MKIFIRTLKSLAFGGLFVLLPLAIIAFVITKAFVIIRPLSTMVAKIVGLDGMMGPTAVTLSSVLLLLGLTVLAGLMVKKGLMTRYNSKVEDTLLLTFPALQRIRFQLADDTDLAVQAEWQAILLEDGDSKRPAFITEESEDGYLSVYIPDAPLMDAGEVRLYEPGTCTYKKINYREAAMVLKRFGKGLRALDHSSAPSAES